jgi:hypothetical protein
MQTKTSRAKKHRLLYLSVILLMSTLSTYTLKAQDHTITGALCISYDNGPSHTTTYTYNIYPSPAGISNLQWSTAGDIAIVGSSTGTSVTIQSQTEAPGGTGDGKGRLYLSYTIDTLPSCGSHVIYTDMYKIFDDSDNIVGPLCVSTGDTVTYSINSRVSVNLSDEIGIDKYKWIIPSSWVPNIQYYSADSSSITFIVGTVTGSDTLIAGVGQCNFIEDGIYADTLVLGKSIPPPILSYPSCLPESSDTAEVKWTNPPAGGTFTSAVWTSPPTWTILATSQDSITLLTDNNPGTVSLAVLGGCQSPVNASAVINRSLGTNSAISGSTCVVAGSQQSYTLTNLPANTYLSWSIVGTGWSFANADTTHQTVLINAGTDSATIYVAASACNSVVDSIKVYTKPANPSTLSGPTSVTECSTDSLTYTVNSVAGAQNYEWIFPAGWSPATATTSGTSVEVKPTPSSTTQQVEVYATGECQNSDTLSLSVAYITPTAPDDINMSKECLNIGESDSIRFSINTPQAGSTYEWSVPAGWTVDSSNTDSTVIKAITTGATGSFTIGARAKDTCGEVSAYTTTNLDVTGLSFTVSSTPGRSTTYFEVDPYPVTGGDYFTWYVGGVLYTQGSGIDYSDITVPNGSLTYPVCADVTNSSTGCKTRVCVSDGDDRPAIDAKTSADNTNTLKVSPNPAHSTLNVQFNDASAHYLRLLNSEGKVVLFKSLSGSTSTTLDVSAVPAGTYVLMAYSNSGLSNATIVIAK